MFFCYNFFGDYMIDINNFQRQKEKVLLEESKTKGIGTISEKKLHKIIKLFLENNEKHHEVKIGQYYADIFSNNIIYEIQTRALNKLRTKLDYFLNLYETHIVFPIPYKKIIHWINCETKEIIETRKSPKTGSIYDSILELYKIKPFLLNSNLKIMLIFLNIEEYRNLDGWSNNKKKGSSRYERIPTELIKIIEINKIEDYKLFLPENLPNNFSNNDFKNFAKINLRQATTCTNILSYLKIITPIAKAGRRIIYKISE